jgi:hypothetical protein
MNSLEQLIAERRAQKRSGLIPQSMQIIDARAEAAVRETLNAHPLDAIAEIVDVQSNKWRDDASYKLLAEGAMKNELDTPDGSL